MTFKRTALIASSATLALGGFAFPATAATNLIQNGNFANNFTNWTLTENNVNASAKIQSGSNDSLSTPSPDAAANYVYFTTDTGTDKITQSVSLIAGHTYKIGYDFGQFTYNNYATFNMALTIGSTTLNSFSSSSYGANTWYNINTTYTAQTTGSFLYGILYTAPGSTANDAFVDRAYVIDVTPPVPEPATWMMLILGFGAVGVAIRRSGLRKLVRLGWDRN